MADKDGLLIRLLDVCGANFSVCVENKIGRPVTLASISLQCGVQTDDRTKAELFKAPLCVLYGNRKIEAGAELLDVSVQGCGPGEPSSTLALRHVSAIITMISSRTSELAAEVTDPARRSRFKLASREFLDALFKLQHDRSENLLMSFRSYDGILHPELRATFLGQGGDLDTACADIGNVALASWLGVLIGWSDSATGTRSSRLDRPIPDYVEAALRSPTSP